MNISPEFLIFSVQQLKASKGLNIKNHIQVLNFLSSQNIPFTVVNGQYEGIKEPAIMVAVLYESIVQKLTADFNQDCYLYIDANRQASLHLPNGQLHKMLGSFNQVPNVQGIENFTELNGRFFVASF